MVMTQLVLAKRPGLTLDADTTELVERDLETPTEGAFRVRISHVALEVSMLGWMREGRSYVPNIAIGDPIRANGVGVVEESRHPDFQPGDLVTGLFDAASHAISDGKVAVKLDPDVAAPAAWAGSMGLTTAFTSFVGLDFAARDLGGKSVLVTGASGLVGGYAAQLAKQRGARVIGTAGSDAACETVVKDLGLDACLNYNAIEDLEAAMREAFPERIDVFFDNVGGEIFDNALGWMNAFGTIIMCGQTAERALPAPPPVTKIRTVIMERLAIHGFIVFDHSHLFDAAARTIGHGVKTGKLIPPHGDIFHDGGLRAFYQAYTDLVNDPRKGKHVLTL